MLFKSFEKLFWKIRIDINLQKLKTRKDVPEVDSAEVKIDQDRYAMPCMWFESNIILF